MILTRFNLALALCVLALTSCGGRARNYRKSDMDFGSIQAVAVMPFQNLTRDNLASERVRDVFANSLLATEAFYVVPSGEVLRGVSLAGVAVSAAPNVDEVLKLGKQLKVGAVITGVLKEYGEVRSGTTSANVISVTVQMIESETGQVVWSGSSTKGGVSLGMRIFGGGGQPMNAITQEAVDDLLDQLFD